MEKKKLSKSGTILIISFVVVSILLVISLIVFFNPDMFKTYIYDGGANVQLSSSNDEKTTILDGEENVITPDEIDLEFTYKTVEDYLPFSNPLIKTPSIGDSKILVLPIIIPGYDLSSEEQSQTLIDLDKLFFGSEDDTYWESVSSFYQKSSYDQLHFSGEVMPWFDSQDAGFNIFNPINDVEDIFTIIEAALDTYEASGLYNLDDFDSDNDGYIDSVWCVYSAPDFQTAEKFFNTSLDSTIYWAFTSWYYNNFNIYREDYSVFGWASIYMMYYNYNSEIDFSDTNNTLDAHTFIHETGHMMGLNDYYNYNNSSAFSFNAPMGWNVMMDANVGDHDLYSKMMLGWVKPYIVIGDCSIELASNQYKDSLVVLLDNSSTALRKENDRYIFNPFNEYILVENYSSEGLNLLDSENEYTNGVKAISGEGFKVYHVDNRLFRVATSFGNSGVNELSEYDHETFNSEYHALYYFISNSTGEVGELTTLETYDMEVVDNEISDYFNEVSLIDSRKNYTYQRSFVRYNGGAMVGVPATERDLFNEGDLFNMSTYSEYFVNGDENKFNNGHVYDTNVTFA